MSKRSVTHATFVIERTYDAPPARVFNAFADPAIKSQWFSSPEDWESGKYTLDFRVGGGEHAGGGPPAGPVHTYDAVYRDIVPNQRIITTYEMHMDDKRISVSVGTFEFAAKGAGTKLTYTEQGAFLDGFDKPEIREHGTRDLLDALGKLLAKQR